MWKLEEAGIDHLASRCQAVLPVSVPRSRARTVTAQHRPARGLQVHFRADSFLCVLLPAPGVCAPCRRHGLARRARPSLRQWVWTWVGEEGESRMCLLPLLPLPRFFPPSEREVPSFCGESRLYHSVPSAVAGLWRTR